MKKQRKHNYVVGYIGENQCVYGKDLKVDLRLQVGSSLWVDPMTLLQAKRKLKGLTSAKAAIYELVPLEET